jgi:hypothetical protein
LSCLFRICISLSSLAGWGLSPLGTLFLEVRFYSQRPWTSVLVRSHYYICFGMNQRSSSGLVDGSEIWVNFFSTGTCSFSLYSHSSANFNLGWLGVITTYSDCLRHQPRHASSRFSRFSRFSFALPWRWSPFSFHPYWLPSPSPSLTLVSELFCWTSSGLGVDLPMKDKFDLMIAAGLKVMTSCNLGLQLCASPSHILPPKSLFNI